MATLTNPDLYAKTVGRHANEMRARLSPSWVRDVIAVHEFDPHASRRTLYIDVRFDILSENAANPCFKWSPDIDTRLRAALLIKDPSPKSIRVERRLFQARASHARITKLRKVRK